MRPATLTKLAILRLAVQSAMTRSVAATTSPTRCQTYKHSRTHFSLKIISPTQFQRCKVETATQFYYYTYNFVHKQNASAFYELWSCSVSLICIVECCVNSFLHGKQQIAGRIKMPDQLGSGGCQIRREDNMNKNIW